MLGELREWAPASPPILRCLLPIRCPTSQPRKTVGQEAEGYQSMNERMNKQKTRRLIAARARPTDWCCGRVTTAGGRRRIRPRAKESGGPHVTADRGRARHTAELLSRDLAGCSDGGGGGGGRVCLVHHHPCPAVPARLSPSLPRACLSPFLPTTTALSAADRPSFSSLPIPPTPSHGWWCEVPARQLRRCSWSTARRQIEI